MFVFIMKYNRYLNNNNLIGFIPESIGNLTKLYYL